MPARSVATPVQHPASVASAFGLAADLMEHKSEAQWYAEMQALVADMAADSGLTVREMETFIARLNWATALAQLHTVPKGCNVRVKVSGEVTVI